MDTTNENHIEDTVKVTISMPGSLLEKFDERCRKARPKMPRSRRIQELIIHDLDAQEEMAVPA